MLLESVPPTVAEGSQQETHHFGGPPTDGTHLSLVRLGFGNTHFFMSSWGDLSFV